MIWRRSGSAVLETAGAYCQLNGGARLIAFAERQDAIIQLEERGTVVATVVLSGYPHEFNRALGALNHADKTGALTN